MNCSVGTGKVRPEVSLHTTTHAQDRDSARTIRSQPVWDSFASNTHIEFISGFLSYKQNFTENKKSRQSWSLGSWAKRLKLSSAAPLTNILKGRKLPSADLLERMIESMGLKPLQAEFLNTLVELARQKNGSNQSVQIGLLRKLRALKAIVQTETLDSKRFQFVCLPQHLVIRQMVSLSDFREDEEWIQNHIRLEMTRDEIRHSIQDLIHVGLLERKPDGRLIATSPFVQTEQDVANENGKKFLTASMELAKRALYEVPLAERDFSSDVINVRSDRIGELKTYLDQFRQELNGSFAAQDDSSDAVYQVNLQIFPVAGRKKDGAA